MGNVLGYSMGNRREETDDAFDRLSDLRTYEPTLTPPSKLISRDQIQKIVPHLPFREAKLDWIKLFDNQTNGSSFPIFYDKIFLRGPTIIMIKIEGDSSGHVFGMFASQSWNKKNKSDFYGDPQSFLFCCGSTTEIFRPSSLNRHFQYLNPKEHGLAMGGQLGFFSLQIEKNLRFVKSNKKTSTFPSTPDLCDPKSSNSESKEKTIENVYDDFIDNMERENKSKIELIEVYGFPLSEKNQLDLQYAKKLKDGRVKDVLSEDGNPDMFLLKSSGVMKEHRHVKQKK